MALVGGQRPAPALVAIESHRIEAAIVEPEALELVGYARRSASQLVGPRAAPFELEQPPPPPFGRHRVPLRLDQRDRGVQRRPVLVEDAVPRVLPALVGEAAGGPPAVLEQPVAVEVAVAIDPLQGRVDLWSQLTEEDHRTGPVGVLG